MLWLSALVTSPHSLFHAIFFAVHRGWRERLTKCSRNQRPWRLHFKINTQNAYRHAQRLHRNSKQATIRNVFACARTQFRRPCSKSSNERFRATRNRSFWTDSVRSRRSGALASSIQKRSIRTKNRAVYLPDRRDPTHPSRSNNPSGKHDKLINGRRKIRTRDCLTDKI